MNTIQKYLSGFVMIVTLLVLTAISVSAVDQPENIDFDVNVQGTSDSAYLVSADGCGGFDDGRFVDGDHLLVYKFDLADNVTAAWLTVTVGNEYLLWLSKNNTTWTEVARFKEHEHEVGNMGDLVINLTPYLKDNPQKIVYLRFGDSFPEEGWGSYVKHIKITYGEAPPAATGNVNDIIMNTPISNSKTPVENVVKKVIPVGFDVDLRVDNQIGLRYVIDSDSKTKDDSWVSYYHFGFEARKKFSDKDSAWLATRTYGDPKGIRNIPSTDNYDYGYTHKYSDALSLTWKYTHGEEFLPGLLSYSSKWGWNYYLPAGTMVKVDANPLAGLKMTYIFMPAEDNGYMAKAEYAGSGFKVGGGYSDIIYKNIEKMASYDVYGEVSMFPGIILYYEYNDANEGEYLYKVDYTKGPVTAQVLFANLDSKGELKGGIDEKLRCTDYQKNTIDTSVIYRINDKWSLGGGAAYLTKSSDFEVNGILSTQTTGITKVSGTVAYNLYSAKVAYDCLDEYLRFYGTYKLAGDNLLEMGFDEATKETTVQLWIKF